MATRYYCRNTNADTSCDTANSPLDLSKTQGSGPNATVSAAIGDLTFVECMSFDVDVSGDSPSTGTHSVSLDVSAMDTRAEARFRVQVVNNSCTVTQNSAYSSAFTAVGVQTLTTGSLTWAAENRLRISVEIRRTSGGGTRSLTIDTENADSWIDAPWTAATPTSKVMVVS